MDDFNMLKSLRGSGQVCKAQLKLLKFLLYAWIYKRYISRKDILVVEVSPGLPLPKLVPEKNIYDLKFRCF